MIDKEKTMIRINIEKIKKLRNYLDDTCYDTLNQKIRQHQNYFFNPLPNEYDNISFDDFVMFARSCVELATFLFNHISFDYEKIVMDATNPQKADWKKYTKERREKAILNYINTLFRVDDTLDAEIAYLADIVMAQ